VFYIDGRFIAPAAVIGGTAVMNVQLPDSFTVGQHTLTAQFSGWDSVPAGTGQGTVAIN
jgi:hypothetical protein